MLFKVSPHLEELAKKSPAIRRQFFLSDKEKECSLNALIDPLLEDSHEKVKGLVHKYPKRVLIILTLNCASFCRFCTRRRNVSVIEKGKIDMSHLDKMIKYIKAHKEINEVIFSGGDPVVTPKLLIAGLKKFAKLKQIKIMRVHTRTPISDPRLLTKDILKTLTEINKQKTLYVSLHFEHPDELTPETIKAVEDLRRTGAILFSQSVFLKGINDSYNTLAELFSSLAELGVRPYYIYHCDLVKGIEHFIVPIKKEVEIMTRLRKNLSGLAFPIHVVDTPNGSGKIPVPLGFWKSDLQTFADFKGKKIKMY